MKWYSVIHIDIFSYFLKHEGPLTTTFKHNTFKLEKT